MSNRQEVIDAFKAGLCPYIDGFQIKEQSEGEPEKDDFNNFIEYIENESKGIKYDLFKHYFNFVVPSALVKQLDETKNKKKNNKLVNVIKSGLSDLKNKIEKMSEEEIENEQPDKILKIVEEIPEFNKQNRLRRGLNILTPDQMLSRSPITLAQLNAGNNSEELKNDIRQLLYFLCRSKKLTKNIYESLVGVI